MKGTLSRILDTIRRLTVRPFTLQPLTAGIGFVSIAALFAGNWILLGYSSRLEAALDARASSMAPRAGTRVPELLGWTLDGESVTIDYAEDTRQTLMLVFSTECSIADANWPYWESVAKQIDTERFRLVYVNISLSMSEDYSRTHYFHPDAYVLARVDPQSAVDYSLSLSPTVLLIDNDGLVQEVWLGTTKDASRREMESALRVALADLDLGV